MISLDCARKEAANERTINIRSVQHYMYCPRRYALLEINRDWKENGFVVSADIMHEHVHDGSHDYSDKRKVVRSAVTVYNDLPEYDLYGVIDCVEFLRSDDGIEIKTLGGKFKVNIVEYKPKAPKDGEFNETDAIQVFAQKICADRVWGCSGEAFLYYADTRKRVRLPFDTEFEKYDEKLKSLLREMRKLLGENFIPPKNNKQKCSGCSLADLCFPKKQKYCIKTGIEMMKGETE